MYVFRYAMLTCFLAKKLNIDDKKKVVVVSSNYRDYDEYLFGLLIFIFRLSVRLSILSSIC